MAFESFQMNIKLTDYGYQKVMALDGAPVGIKYIGLGKGNADNTAGYDVNFRQSQTALAHQVIIKQIDSSQKESYVEDGQNLARIDTATIFDGNENFDVRELGYYDEDENGDVGQLVYVWSSADPEEIYAPKRSKIHLVVSISQHLLFSEEAGAITVVDAGLPFELFLQPLKDDFEESLAIVGVSSVAALAGLTAKFMQSINVTQQLQSDFTTYKDASTILIDDLEAEVDTERDERIAAIQIIEDRENQRESDQELINIGMLAAMASNTGMTMRNVNIGGS